jgi:hypothetical protein
MQTLYWAFIAFLYDAIFEQNQADLLKLITEFN